MIYRPNHARLLYVLFSERRLPPRASRMRVRRLTLPLVVCSFAALFTAAANAAGPDRFTRQIWVTPGIYSFHFNRHKGLRNANPGFGVEIALAPDHAVMAGTYINSNDARSRYVAWGWRPLHGRFLGAKVSAGIVATLIDGYPNYRNGGWYAAPLPVVSIEGRRFGVNVSLIPTLPGRVDGALSFQFKLRVN